MLPENYFENIKKLKNLEKAYIKITKYVDRSLGRLNTESYEMVKNQNMLVKKMQKSKSSNDIKWFQDELMKINNKSLMIKGAAQILSELAEVIKENVSVKGNDKEGKIIK